MKSMDEIVYTELWDRLMIYKGSVRATVQSLKIGKTTVYRYLRKFKMLDELRMLFPAKKAGFTKPRSET